MANFLPNSEVLQKQSAPKKALADAANSSMQHRSVHLINTATATRYITDEEFETLSKTPMYGQPKNSTGKDAAVEQADHRAPRSFESINDLQTTTPRLGLLQRIKSAVGFGGASKKIAKSDEPWLRADRIRVGEISSCEKPLSEMRRKTDADSDGDSKFMYQSLGWHTHADMERLVRLQRADGYWEFHMDMYIDIASRYSPYITMSRIMDDKWDIEDKSNVAMTKKILTYFEDFAPEWRAELELVLKKAGAWLNLHDK